MGMTLDLAEVRAYSASLASRRGQISGRGAAVLRKVAYDIEADAKALAPVDTGALRSSISTEINGDGRFASMSAVVGPTVEYGVFQEFGTSTQPGQPYLGPAFDRRLPGFEAAVAQLGAEALS